MPTERMTEQDARQFDRYSVANAATVSHALSCGCEPYVDVFTYRRWQAQGFQVQRGQHAVKIPTIRRVEKKQDDGTTERVQIRRVSSVFCRCQVERIH